MTHVVTAAQQARDYRSLEAMGLSVLVVVCTGASSPLTALQAVRRARESLRNAGFAVVAEGRAPGGGGGRAEVTMAGEVVDRGAPAVDRDTDGAPAPVIVLAATANETDACTVVAAARSGFMLGPAGLPGGRPVRPGSGGAEPGLFRCPGCDGVPGSGADERLAGAGAGLTEREVEVLQAFANGATTVEVVRTLNVSPKTVKNHLAHIYAKLGAADRTQAVSMALRLGIVRLER